MSTPAYAPYVEPPKSASKMSFYSEEAAATVARIPNATPKQHAAARRFLAKRPDCHVLTQIIFGTKK